MGSSPVTATKSSAQRRLLRNLESFLERHALSAGETRLVVAFSGGPDSLALLWGLRQLSASGSLRLLAAHLDHGMDAESAVRRQQAVSWAVDLGVEVVSDRLEIPRLRQPGESPETAARRVRYAFLEEVRLAAGALAVVTAHHQDDQAETLVQRLRHGTSWRGLAGIQAARGTLLRPLLALSKEDLRAALRATGLQAIDDPTNLSLAAERNRVRANLMPQLSREDPEIVPRLGRIAGRVQRLRPSLDGRLLMHVGARPNGRGIEISRQALANLPASLRAPVLAALHERMGAPLPSSAAAQRELARQLLTRQVACDCGNGFRWRSLHQDTLLLYRPCEATARPFSYTLRVPGRMDLPDLALALRLTQGPVESWMFQRWPRRAGLALPIEPGGTLEIRSRRPGDRLRPFGHRSLARLKELLISARVPREERDRLPLLVESGNIAWVPGVTVDERYRVRPGQQAWIAELVDLGGRECGEPLALPGVETGI